MAIGLDVGKIFMTDLYDVTKSKLGKHKIPVVPHKAVAEVSQ